MKNRMRKILGFLTVLCLAAGIQSLSAVPVYADTAAGTGKAMQLVGTDNPSGGIADQDHIYLGIRDDTNYTWTDDAPYWRVLDADEMNTGDAGMFLLSESLIGNNPGGSYGNIYFNQDSTKGNAWQGSDARNWCGRFLTNVFSGQEQDAIAAVTKSDDAYPTAENPLYSEAANILSGDRVFFLSVGEAVSTEYGFENEASRIAQFESNAADWWLRSPVANSSYYVGEVGKEDGTIYQVDVSRTDVDARPAFNLDMSKVLFTSAAVDGKLPGTAGKDALTEVSAYTGSDWKLTLKDSSRSGFTAAFDSQSGDEVTISYSGAKAGTKEYISAIIVNSSGEITYYGHLAAASAENDSTCTVNLDGKYKNGDTLCVFNEQANGDKKTDYASPMQVIIKPTLTIAVKEQTYIYDGQPHGESDPAYDDPAVISEKVTVKGLLESDELTMVELDGEETEIGEYPDRIGVTGFSINNDPGAKDKYEVTLVPGKLIIKKEEPPVPPTHVHSLTVVMAKAATCEETGNKTYYTCSGCGKWFEDDTALVEITDKSSVIIKALGHKWDSGVVTKAPTATKDGIRTYTCLRDSSHTKTELIPRRERSVSNHDEPEFNVAPAEDAWLMDGAGWHYRENGVLVKNAWRTLKYNGVIYWYLFDENGTMKTGWAEWKGERYYLSPVSDGWMGHMLTGWQQIDGKWYYFETAEGSTQGRMYRNEKTPDGRLVGEDGALIEGA